MKFEPGQAKNLGLVWSGQGLSERSMGVVIAGWSRVKARFSVRSRSQARNLVGQDLDPGRKCGLLVRTTGLISYQTRWI